jgi:CRP/FNR family transcriptional regulator, cyclic AMP receptor protein
MSSDVAGNEPFRTLLTAKNRLEFLTSDDWALLAGKSQVLTFGNAEVIIQAGVRPRQLFFILSGKALIESARGGKLAEVSDGDVCGEMSFLEDTIASARVVAEGDVETLAIEWTALDRLFDEHSDLGSRFFHSLAIKLSSRLRGQVSRARG